MLGQKMAQVPLDKSQMIKTELAAKKLQDKADKEIDGQARLRELEAVGSKGQKRKNLDSSMSRHHKAQRPSSSASEKKKEEENNEDSEDEEGAGDNTLMAGRKGDAIYTGRGKLAKPRGGTNLQETYQGHEEYGDLDDLAPGFNEYNAEDYVSDKEYYGSEYDYVPQSSSHSSNNSNCLSEDLLKQKSSSSSRPEDSRSRAPCKDNSLFGLGSFDLKEIAKQANALASKYPGSGMKKQDTRSF
jgi:hypothetical protein